jgi:hypothetical protein
MTIRNSIFLFLILMILLPSCKEPITQIKCDNPAVKVIFLHHSTGRNVWYGDVKRGKSFGFKQPVCMVPRLIDEYNKTASKKISIEERNFPSGKPYPWNNNPYDYYNIWVKNAGSQPFIEEPTLEILTKQYNVIIFKHCYPSSQILEDDGKPDVNSEKLTIANMKLQYDSLKAKMHEFPKTKFIVWTGAALLEKSTNKAEAERAKGFFEWVKTEWDETGDNIEIFDFRNIETEGGLYLKPEYSADPSWDSHPNRKVSAKAAELFVQKIIQVAESN